MAKHQIIYTSCMRGIDGVNDGQQIYSYDEGFTEAKSDEVRSLFRYQEPSLAPGVMMTEELALAMPSSFSYNFLPSGNVAVSLNTYLGRDYMGSAGRFGNFLSHSILCDFDDFNIYPCELYGGTVLRSRMEYEEVNNPNTPPYLPEAELIKGYIIDPDSVVEFLGIADHLDYFKKMFAALLAFPIEKKRLVIHDEKENIAKWIAALHYSLPLDIAKKVNFTTYEYDPELSPARICGVVEEGTKYNCDEYIASERQFVFDFIRYKFSPVEASNILMDFLDTSFSFSYDSLVDFHSFVLEETEYRDCDERYYAAYYLYHFLSEGIGDISKNQFEAIVDFSEDFAKEETKRKLLGKILEEVQTIKDLDLPYAMYVLGFLLRSFNILSIEEQNSVKELIVDRLITTLSDEGITETEFLPLYERINSLALSINLSLPAMLMLNENKDKLLAVLSRHAELWKVYFVIKIISSYVKDMHLSTDELYPDRAIGAIYRGLVETAYQSGRRNGEEIVERILDGFREEVHYFVNMALNLEGFLLDMHLGEEDKNHLWAYFSKTVFTMDEIAQEESNKILAEYERYTEMYALFEKKMDSFSSFTEAGNFFHFYWERWFSKNRDYGTSFAALALKHYEEIYEKKMGSLPDKERFHYAKEILNMAIKMEIRDSYVNPLSDAVIEYLPAVNPSSDEKALLNEVYRYKREVLHEPIQGKLYQCIVAIRLNQIQNPDEIKEVCQSIRSEVEKRGRLSECKLKEYYERAFYSFSAFPLLKEDYEEIYRLFDFSTTALSLFMEYWCKKSYKESKGEREYTDFSEFLSFMFSIGREEDQEMVGKYLCSLSKQKLEDLDEEMLHTHFNRDRKAAHAWEHVREIAEKTNPLLHNISKIGNIFRKK